MNRPMLIPRAMWRWFIGALFMAGASAAVSAVLLIALTHATTSNHNLIAQNRILITQLQAQDDVQNAKDQKFRAFILILQKQIASLGGTAPTLPPSLAVAPTPTVPNRNTSTPSPSASPSHVPTPTPKPTVNPRPTPTPSPTCHLPIALLCHPLG